MRLPRFWEHATLAPKTGAFVSMEKLRRTLEQVRLRIEAAKRPGTHRMTEEETKVALINP